MQNTFYYLVETAHGTNSAAAAAPPVQGHGHPPTPPAATRVSTLILLRRSNEPPRADWLAAVHHVPSTPCAPRAASSLPCPPLN